MLTGPDHLSALATLSANEDTLHAFLLGVRWGVGHSTGLLLVGIILIVITLDSTADTINVPEGVSHFFESLVGIFMLLLGMYGFRRAWNKRPKGYGNVPDASSQELELSSDLERMGAQETYHNHFGVPHDSPCGSGSRASLEDEDVEEQVARSDDVGQPEGYCRCIAQCVERISTGTMSFFAGIIHGMAGPGGVLGVIPAVQLHDWKLASIYLGCFCISSTLTMGMFALIYGVLSSRLGRRRDHSFLVESVSAALSTLVGILWLVLLSVGKLDDVFP